MTPRAGVKTTLASEMRLPGLPDPKRGPHLFLGRLLTGNDLTTGNAAKNNLAGVHFPDKSVLTSTFQLVDLWGVEP